MKCTKNYVNLLVKSTYVVGTQKNRLGWTVLLSTNNIRYLYSRKSILTGLMELMKFIYNLL